MLTGTGKPEPDALDTGGPVAAFGPDGNDIWRWQTWQIIREEGNHEPLRSFNR